MKNLTKAKLLQIKPHLEHIDKYGHSEIDKGLCHCFDILTRYLYGYYDLMFDLFEDMGLTHRGTIYPISGGFHSFNAVLKTCYRGIWDNPDFDHNMYRLKRIQLLKDALEYIDQELSK